MSADNPDVIKSIDTHRRDKKFTDSFGPTAIPVDEGG